MVDSPHQLTLDLAHRPALGAEDFIVTSSNAAAVEAVDSWPNWPQSTIALIGPPQSGKSHLVQVWCLRSGAPCISADSVSDAIVAQAEEVRALAIEDIDRVIADERVLFHLLNLARQTRLSLLLTSRQAPGELAEISVPDLRSRLRAMPIVTIASPDDALLEVLLVKLFADRQLVVEPPVIKYLARHLERSWAAASAAVSEIDALALSSHRRVSRSLAAKAIQSLNK